MWKSSSISTGNVATKDLTNLKLFRNTFKILNWNIDKDMETEEETDQLTLGVDQLS